MRFGDITLVNTIVTIKTVRYISSSTGIQIST